MPVTADQKAFWIDQGARARERLFEFATAQPDGAHKATQARKLADNILRIDQIVSEWPSGPNLL